MAARSRLAAGLCIVARAITSPEPGYLRGPRQRTRLFVDADMPPEVFACRVNQAFSSNDVVMEIMYDYEGVTVMDYADVLAGMTCLVGSAPGADDLGAVRIRKAADATKIYIGATSEIAWADNLYLTVIAEWRLWAKALALDGSGNVVVDGETAYSNQNQNFAPVIIAGPARRVAKLTGATVDVAFDLSDSWAPDSSISSRSVSAPGATSVTGGTTATPSIRYSAEGRYWVAFTGAAANGKSTTVYRTVRIYSDDDPLLTVFQVSDGSGDYDDGGWRMNLNVYLPATGMTTIRRHAMITLVAEDWYDETKISVGPVEGSENVVAIGWLANEDIHVNPKTGGYVKMQVYGPQYWLDRMGASMMQMDGVTVAPTKWNEFYDLTVDKALQHLMTWRSTIGAVMDVYPSEDTRQADNFPNIDEMLWGQIVSAAGRILAKPCCDRYGRMFVRVNQQFVPVDDRTEFPTVMSLEKYDWRDELTILHNMEQIGRLSQVANLIAGGAEAQTIYSLASGHEFKRLGGNSLSPDADLLVESQAQGNAIAGLRLGQANREYDFDIPIAQNNRMVDICPEQYVGVSIAAEDTPRGIEFDGRMVPRHIDMNYDMKTGFLWFSWSGEQESFPENAINGDIPEQDELPGIPGIELPPIPPSPALLPITLPTTVPTATGPVGVILLTRSHGIWYTKDGDMDSPHWLSFNAGLDPADFVDYWKFEISAVSQKCYLHAGTHTIYVADYVGGPWRVCMTNVDVYNALIGYSVAHTGTGEITGMGVNRGASDEMLVIGSIVGANLEKVTGFLDCNSEGIIGVGAHGVLGGNLQFTQSGMLGEAVFGAGKWLAVFRIVGFNGWMMLVGRHGGSGGDVDHQTNLGSLWYTYQIANLVRCSLDSPRAYWARDANYAMTPDNDNTHPNLTTPPNIGSPGWRREVIAASPTGLNLIAGDEGGYIYRSTDGGTTWGLIVAATGVLKSVWNCGDDNNWLTAIVGRLQFTPDFGETFLEKTGDLQRWTSALVDITQIRTF